jgi:hypothetical protein
MVDNHFSTPLEVDTTYLPNVREANRPIFPNLYHLGFQLGEDSSGDDRSRELAVLFLQLIRPELRSIEVTIIGDVSAKSLADTLHSELFKQVVSPTHLSIGFHLDEDLFESLMLLHPNFHQTIRHFNLRGTVPSERKMKLIASWPALETLRMDLPLLYNTMEPIPKCQGFQKLKEIKLVDFYHDDAYKLLSSIDPKATSIKRLILGVEYSQNQPVLLFPETALLNGLVFLEVHLEGDGQRFLADDLLRHRLGSFGHLQSLTIASMVALEGDDETWEKALRNLCQLRRLSLGEGARFLDFHQDTPTIRVTQIALTHCPFLIRFAGSFDLDQENLPNQPTKRYHHHIQALDLGASYFRSYEMDLSYDFEDPKHWVNRAVTYLTSMAEHPFEINIEDYVATESYSPAEDRVTKWRRACVLTFRYDVETINDRKRNAMLATRESKSR